MDVAREQLATSTPISEPSKGAVTLLDVAKQVASPPVATPSLKDIATEIRVEERAHIEATIVKTASEVKREQQRRRSNLLLEAAAEVQAEDTKAAEVLTVKLQSSTDAAARERQPRDKPGAPPAVDDHQNDGYSSFEEDEDSSAAAKTSTSKGDRKRAQRNSDDNQSDTTGESGPQKTIASDSEESKAFLRAVYFNDGRRVRDMLDDSVVEASIADQVCCLTDTLTLCSFQCE
ncbi:hypothetical protein PINS_up015438 [Pythium insidiosum]|nr:hypothetical protein PINS_up015438 [Pythium insidiosum]